MATSFQSTLYFVPILVTLFLTHTHMYEYELTNIQTNPGNPPKMPILSQLAALSTLQANKPRHLTP